MSSVTYDDLSTHFRLLRKTPEKYLAMAEEFVRENPDHAGGYFSRHWALKRLGRWDEAEKDLHTSVRLEPDFAGYGALGSLYYQTGRYADAIRAFDEAQALEPEIWGQTPDTLFRADCHARLGNETAALADCQALREEHFLPYSIYGAPRGNKAEVTEEIRRRAAAARETNAA
jgi:tetratricopeptide (TPR) repeat protein